MAFAHQGLEPKPPFGVAPPPPAPTGQSVAGAASKAADPAVDASPSPIGLSPRATRAILDIGALARAALMSGKASEAPEPEHTPNGVPESTGSVGSR